MVKAVILLGFLMLMAGCPKAIHEASVTVPSHGTQLQVSEPTPIPSPGNPGEG
jgi:hypothetical protein